MKMTVKEEPMESSPQEIKKKLKRKSKNSNNTQNHTSLENNDVEEQHSPVKKKTKFSAQKFRENLKSKDSKITSLKEFVELCESESSTDYALQYLEAGGNCYEISLVLDSLDINSVVYLSRYVFEAITILVFKIVSFTPQHIASAEEACKQLLNKHLPKIHALLNSNSGKQKRVIIKLLTAIVTLSSSLSKEILLNINFEDSTLGSLLKHPHAKETSESVRKCFTHFLVAFLIDGNAGNIRRVMEKKNLLTSIIPGLIYDDASTVCMVLSTYQKHILENTSVSKTNKLYVFSTPIVKSLVRLYNWKGPRRNQNNVPINDEEKEVVLNTVHDFLLVLCTSFKYGIAFHDKNIGLSRKKHNSLLYSVLDDVEKPWKNKYASDLVAKIIQTCPDLMDLVLSKTIKGLENSEDKLQAYLFLKNIFNEITFHSIEPFVGELYLAQLIVVIEKLCVPKSILTLYTIDRFKETDKQVQRAFLKLLLAMLQSLHKFIDIIVSNKILNVQDTNNLQTSFNEYLNKFLPSANNFLTVWNLKLMNDIKVVILDLFIYYYRLCPRLLNESIPNFTPMKIFENSNKTTNSVILKAAELFLMLNPTVFSPDKKYFSKYFSIICKMPRKGGGNILRRILSNTGLFYACSAEISIWVEAIYNYNIPIELLIKALRLAWSNLTKYTKYIEGVTKTEMYYKKHTKNLDDFFDLIEQDGHDGHTGNFRQAAPINPSPLVLAISKLSVSSDWNKFRPVIVDSIFIQTEPNILLKILSECKQSILRPKNIFSLVDVGDVKLPILIPHENLPEKIIDLSEVLLNRNKDDITSVLSGIKISVNHFRAVVFYFNQLAAKGRISEECFMKFKDALIFIFDFFFKNDDKSIIENLHVFYDHPQIREMFLPFADKNHQMETLVTKFLIEISKHVMNNLDIQEFLIPYKLIFVKRLSMLFKNIDICFVSDNDVLDLLDVFKLEYDEYLKLVVEISEVPPKKFITNENTLSCFPMILAHALTNMIQTYNKTELLNKKTVVRLGECYVFLIRHPISLNTEHLDVALFKFLDKFPHHTGYINQSIFKALLEDSSQNKTKSKLAGFLLSKNDDLSELVRKHFDVILPNRDLIFSIYKEIKELDTSLELKIFEHYKHVLMKNLEKPQKISVFFRENCAGIVKLIGRCVSIDEFTQFTGKVHKFETVDKTHLDVLECIFVRHVTTTRIEAIANNYISILIQMLINILNRDAYDHDTVMYVCKKINSFMKTIPHYKFTHDKVRSSSHWSNYVKVSLKNGLKQDTLHVECNKHLLDTLTVLCQNLYADNSADKNILDEIALVHEMTLSHSEFLNLFLGNNQLKLILAKFLLVLSKKNPAVMSVNHVPLFLGAYNGTTSERPILALLAAYESSSISLHGFRPYLWGEHAISHYSVRGNVETALWRQPSTGQVLDLLNGDIVLNTIYGLDVFIPLEATNEIKNKSRTSEEHFNHIVIDKVKQSKSFKTSHDMRSLKYDPAFYLPLFSHLLAPESVVQHYKFSQSGALAMTLSFLSNQNDEVRAAAGHVISRFYFHLEADAGSSEKKIWLRLIDALRRGAVKYGNHLPCIWSVFLARTAIVLTQPMHPLYSPISYFLMAKESFDFATVPELLKLFHSSEVDYKQHRVWILEVIRDGMKTELDNKIMLRSVAYKYVLDFYSSVLANKDDKLLILQIVKSAVVVNKARKILVFGFGLISWLTNIVDNLTESETESVSLIVQILSRVWKSLVRLSTKQTALVRDIRNAKLNVVHLIVQLSKILSTKIYLSNYVLYIEVVHEAISEFHKYITADNLSCIIKHGTEILGENDCEYMLKYDCQYVGRPSIVRSSSDDLRNSCLAYLRSSTITWIEAKQT